MMTEIYYLTVATHKLDYGDNLKVKAYFGTKEETFKLGKKIVLEHLSNSLESIGNCIGCSFKEFYIQQQKTLPFTGYKLDEFYDHFDSEYIGKWKNDEKITFQMLYNLYHAAQKYLDSNQVLWDIHAVILKIRIGKVPKLTK